MQDPKYLGKKCNVRFLHLFISHLYLVKTTKTRTVKAHCPLPLWETKSVFSNLRVSLSEDRYRERKK